MRSLRARHLQALDDKTTRCRRDLGLGFEVAGATGELKFLRTTRVICALPSFPPLLYHRQTRKVNTPPSLPLHAITPYYDEHAVAPITTTPPIVRENMVIDCLAKRPTDYANYFHAYCTKQDV